MNTLSMAVNELVANVIVVATLGPADTQVEAAPVNCDWVAKVRASGAEEKANNLFGSLSGFIQEYWWYIVGGLVIAALFTLVFKKHMQGAMFRAVMIALAAGFLFSSLLNFGVGFNPGPC